MGLQVFLASMLLAAGATSVLAAGDRVSVPIEQHVTATGYIVYSVQVSVEGTPVDVELDSGSVGLRVPQAALPKGMVITDDQHIWISYDNGMHLSGVAAAARVSFGSLRQSMPIEVVRDASCDPVYPKCIVAKQTACVPRVGLKGIVGISLVALGAKVQTPNPLQNLTSAWIVELPRPDSKEPGQLILNPDASDLKGFDEFPAGSGGSALSGRDNPIPGCIKNDGNGKSFCGPVVLDTGKPVVTVITDAFKDTRTWAASSPVELSFGGSGATILSAKFTVKPAPSPTRVLLGPFPNLGKPTLVLAGAEPYLLFDVLYDAANQKIGIRRR